MSAREPDHIDAWIKQFGKQMKEAVSGHKWNSDWVPSYDRKRAKKKHRDRYARS